MKFFHRALRIVFACCIGLLCFVLIIEDHADFKQRIESMINERMSSSYRCIFTTHVKKLCLLSGDIDLEDLYAHDPQKTAGPYSWFWQAHRAQIHIAWLKLLWHWRIELDIEIFDVMTYSTGPSTSITIAPHIQALMQNIPSVIPVIIKKFNLYAGTCTLILEDINIRCFTHYTINAYSHHDTFPMRISLMQGSGFFNENIFCKNLEGSITFGSHNKSIACNYQIGCDLPYLSFLSPNNRCLIVGSQKENVHTVTIAPESETFLLALNIQDTLLKGSLQTSLSNYKLSFIHKGPLTQGYGKACILHTEDPFCKIAWQWDKKKNNHNITMNSPLIDLSGTYTHNTIKAKYSVSFPQQKKITGTLTCAPTMRSATITLCDQKRQLANISYEKNILHGFVEYAIVPWYMGSENFSGEGHINFSGGIVNTSVQLLVTMKDGTLRIPSMFNIIRNMTGTITYDPFLRKLYISDGRLDLHKGSIICSSCQMHFNDHWQPNFVYASVLGKDCFSMYKDFFITMGGNLHIYYDASSTSFIKGTLIGDRCHIRSNFLSQDMHAQRTSDFFAPCIRYPKLEKINLDIMLETRSPLRVKTDFLETTARCSAMLQGTIAHPRITGTAEILSGTLFFPYQSLYITAGKIMMHPDQLENPLIDIYARGAIKKYMVGMSITGTLQDPIIHFESSPLLREEEIISLLLGGSEDGSLYMAIPQTIKKKVEELLFGSSTPYLQKYFKTIFKPLKNIRFVPGFSDQSGRGGIRGTLEIDVNDRLKGRIQQNFSLSEDTKIEVEYALSDDMTIRALQDERGDLGAEIEACWKF